nr:hypothetical protein [Tanacetum cinerariifolium]
MTMDTTIEQHAAMDEALVPYAQSLRIGRSIFCLLSDIKSKESTLQLVYDVLRICSFVKAFLVTANVPEIYMQELWATATVHHHAIRFQMDNKKHIVNLELFRDILHICIRVHGQSFDEPSFEEEILAFIYFLRHSVAIMMLTDVNINKLYHPWRSFVAIINKCLTGKSSSYDPSIPRRNKVNWHYVRDDHMFSTIKLVSRHQNMQQFGALLPIELTNEEIRNSNAYKEYYAIATRAAPPKPKASVRRTQSSSNTSITPPTTAASPRLTSSQKGKQAAKACKAKSLSALSKVAMTEAQQLKLKTKRSIQQTHISYASGSGTNEGTGSILGVLDVPTDESEEDLSWNSTDDEGDADEGKDGDDEEEDEGDDGDGENDDGEEGNDDDDDQVVKQDDDKDDDEEGGDDDQEYDDEYAEETRDEESFDPIPQTLENNDDEGMESIFETTSQLDVQTPIFVALFPIYAPTMMPSTIATITTTSQALILPTTVLSNIIQNLPNFSSLFCFDNRLRSLEVNFSKAMQTNQFAGAVSAIPGIVHQYMDHQMNEAVKVAVQIQSNHLRDKAQRDNEEFLKTIDENMQKIIKEHVKELVKILINKLEGNKSIQRSDEQMNLYRALVEAYESDKIILDIYRETVTLKRRRDNDADKDEEPSTRPDRGSKRCREGKEPESKQPSPDRDWNKTVPTVYGSIQPWISELVKQADTRSSFNELMDTPLDFSNFIINQLKVNTLTLELLAGHTYKLMKGSCKSLVELEYHLEEVFKVITDQLDWVNPEGVSHWRRKHPQFYGFTINQESARDVYSKRRIIAITELKIVEWHSYKHLYWITMQRDDDKLYKFKEGDFKRLRIQDIEDMLLLLIQGKQTYLTAEEHFAFNNKDKRNRLMRIDELHKFSDGMLMDVRTALDDHLKGI